MDSSVLQHPRIAQAVDSLVAAGGGRITYDTGGGGREILVAAGARLAAQTGTPLTIVEYRHLHAQARFLVREVQPDISSAVISASEAALQPAGSINGVLAVHADVLRDPDVRQPLLAMAHSADHLVLARHDDSDTTLDALAIPGLVLRLRDLMPPAPRPNPVAVRWTSPDAEARKQRILRQLNRGEQGDGGLVSFEEFAAAMQNADPDELRQRIEQMQEQQRQRSADRPTPGPRQQATRDHGQGQSAAHQHHHPRSPGLT
ncbi:hypothetical protein [[Kitasatospora] papulosa]|uniref:hypothetical protein n=1 Tax=[Kitasatospora] papulosa TaxID=1464011 RepID=UPI00363531B3